MAYTTIDKPSDYFNTKLYTGNGSTQSITGVGFQPNWVWIKNSTAAENHFIFDSVRGALNVLKSNSSGSAGDTPDSLTAFTSDGFNLGNLEDTNRSGNAVASWNWKAGTSVSGNTTGSGSAKAYTGSVSTTAGFSIIRYLGNGTNGHTIPHHLGAAPRWILVKRLDSSSGGDWTVLHMGLPNGAGDFMELNATGAKQTSSARWRDATPTSSVFTVASGVEVNGDDSPYIAYVFAEKQGYSKFGSYTGNGNASGPMIVTGFSPAWLIIKKATGAANSWFIIDNKRSPFNVSLDFLLADTSDANATGSQERDLLSNGFKIRNSNNGLNTSGETYIYMAFAEQPFVSSSGVPATAR